MQKNMIFDVKIYKSFTKDLCGGNPAGVLICSEPLDNSIMQKIAKKNALPETVFILPSQNSMYRLKYFTPNSEIDMCGHATIAAIEDIKINDASSCEKFSIETNIGILKGFVEIGKIFFQQNTPAFSEIIEKEAIIDCFDNVDYIDEFLPIQVVSTGVRDIFLPIKNRTILNLLNPKFEKITELSNKMRVIGIHAFTVESDNKMNYNVRNFAPLYGIPEEAATGTSNSALACYLFKYLSDTIDTVNYFVFKQGQILKSPSEIYVSLEVKGKNFVNVQLGGTAVFSHIRKIKI